jgi:hypothetical protein
MKSQTIEIQNRLPDGIGYQIYQHAQALKAMLVKEGFGPMAEKFLRSMLAEMRDDPLADWHQWEGYFTDFGDTMDLLALGALFFHNQIHVRAILCQDVPKSQVAETEKALSLMLDEYLTKLHSQNVESQSDN